MTHRSPFDWVRSNDARSRFPLAPERSGFSLPRSGDGGGGGGVLPVAGASFHFDATLITESDGKSYGVGESIQDNQGTARSTTNDVLSWVKNGAVTLNYRATGWPGSLPCVESTPVSGDTGMELASLVAGNSTFTYDDNLTFFFVSLPTATVGSQGFFFITPGNTRSFFSTPARLRGQLNGAGFFENASSDWALNTPHLYTLIANPDLTIDPTNKQIIRENGVQTGQQVGGAMTAEGAKTDTHFILGSSLSNDNIGNKVAEFVMYNRTLTLDEILSVESYLQARHGTP